MWTSCTLASDVFLSVVSEPCCHAFSFMVSFRAQPVVHVTFWNFNLVGTPALSNEITTRSASFLTVTTADALFAQYNRPPSACLDYFITVKLLPVSLLWVPGTLNTTVQGFIKEEVALLSFHLCMISLLCVHQLLGFVFKEVFLRKKLTPSIIRCCFYNCIIFTVSYLPTDYSLFSCMPTDAQLLLKLVTKATVFTCRPTVLTTYLPG